MVTEIRTPPPRRWSRGRVLLVAALAVVVVALFSARGVAGFYTDYLWFDSIGFTAVWKGLLWAKVGLVVLFVVVAFAVVWVNLFIADRFAPAFRPPGPEESALEGVNAVFDRRPRTARAGVAGVAALFVAGGVGGHWHDWILFRNRVDFGVNDPQFRRDIGFYVFQLPFVSFVMDWLFAALLVVTIVTIAAHYRNGGIRLQVPGAVVTPAVRGHVSILLAAIAARSGR